MTLLGELLKSTNGKAIAFDSVEEWKTWCKHQYANDVTFEHVDGDGWICKNKDGNKLDFLTLFGKEGEKDSWIRRKA